MGDLVKKTGLKQFSPAGEGISIDYIDHVKGILSRIMPSRKLSQGEAAAMLNVPESHLESLLEEKKLPLVLNGTGRKVRYRDVMNYKASRDRQRQEGLVQLAAMTQECDNRYIHPVRIFQGYAKPLNPVPTTVLLDANILYPFYTRDVFLNFFVGGLIRAHWTECILAKWIGSTSRKLPNNIDSILRQENRMREDYPEAMVTGFEHHIESLHLPDPDDRHVLAAAIQCGTRYIVTEDMGDFPGEYLAQFGIEPLGPGAFLGMIWDRCPNEARKVLLKVRGNYRNPPFNMSGFLELLHGINMGEIAVRLGEA
ncbi:MAG: PIN domain-containing protein [Paracoccaceae bacterium]|nr:PIN domain-containing protein [Paracoccaceae bacterium]MDE2916910.1 PIN domain-containing protein [Paracoccaceae bacterium]